MNTETWKDNLVMSLPCIITGQAGATSPLGALVTSATFIDTTSVSALNLHLTQKRTVVSAQSIQSIVPAETVTIPAERFNRLIHESKDLATILCWAHTRAIRNLLQCYPQATAIYTGEGAPYELIKENLTKQYTNLSILTAPQSPGPLQRASRILAATTYRNLLEELVEKHRDIFSIFKVKPADFSLKGTLPKPLQSIEKSLLNDVKKKTSPSRMNELFKLSLLS